MKARNENLLGRLQQLTPATATTIGLLYLAGVGLADSQLLPGIRFLLLYVLGVAFVGWRAGPWRAFAGAVFASGVSILSEFIPHQSDYSITILVWSDSSRFLLFAVVGGLAARAGRLTRELSGLVEERTASLSAEAEQHKATASTLAETVERFEQVVNNITEVFFLSEFPDSRLVYASPGYEHVWGRQCAELYRDPLSWLATLHPDDREQISRRFPGEQAKGGWNVEYRIIRPDGAIRWIRDRAFPVRNQQGEVYRIAGLAEDITERRQARELLQTQAAILENMHEGVVVTDEQGLIVQMNPAAERIWGYPRNEVIGQPASVFSALPEPEAAAVMREVLASLQATGSWRGVFHNRRKDGARISCEAVISRLQIHGRKLMVAVEQDITERLRADQALRQSEETLRGFLHALPEPAMVLDRKGLLLVSNQALARGLGLPEGALAGKCVFDFLPPVTAAKRRAMLEQVVASGKATQFPDVRGERVFVSWVSPVLDAAGSVSRVAVIAFDVTERQRAEEALRQSEETLRVLLHGIPEPAFLLDTDGRILVSNPVLARRLALPEGDLRGKDAFSLLPPNLAESRKTVFDRVVRSRQPAQFEDSRQGRHFANFFNPILDGAGNVTRVAVFALDFTERKQAEAVLREANDKLQERTAALQAANVALTESEERYRSLVTNLNVGVFRSAPAMHGRLLHVNPALARIHGFDSPEEFQRLRVSDTYLEPGDREALLAELHLRGSVAGRELRLKRKDGTFFYASVNATAHREPNGEVDWIDGALEDITERKKAEQSLAESLELNRTLISASTVGIAAYKASGQCVIANEALARISGGTVEQLLQQDFRQLKSWRTDGLLAKAEAALVTRQPQELEGPSRTTFGRELFISARFASFVSQGEEHLLVMVTDETQARRAHEALRVSEERYRTLAESSPDAIFILDRDIRLQYVNWKAAALFRRQPQELVGLEQADLFQGETAQTQTRIIREVFATGNPVRREKPLSFPVGDQWIEIRLAPIYDAQCKVNSVMGICRDVTERKRAEQQLSEALDLNQKMIAASSMGFAAYKASGECVLANEALARMVGGSLGEVRQGNFRRMESWRESGLLTLAEEALSQGQARSGEIFATTRFGKAVSVDCHVAPFVSNGLPHLLLVALDISERKLAESLLRAQRDVGVSLSLTSDMTVALDHFLEIAVHIGGLDCGGVYLLNEVAQELELAAHSGLSASFVKLVAHYSANSPEMKLVLQGHSVFSTYQNLPLHHSPAVLREGLRAIAVIPLSHNRKIIGALNMASHTVEEIPMQARIVVEAVATQAAGAIARISSEAERHRLEHQILDISDREHARIGQDIHDGLCQHLVSLALDANSLRGQLAAAHRPEARTARRIADYLDEAITEARQLSRGLFPVRLAREGLPPALEELAATTRERFKIQCRFASEGSVAVESSIMATHLYRIAQEAVSNAVKHSRATTITIQLRALPQTRNPKPETRRKSENRITKSEGSVAGACPNPPPDSGVRISDFGLPSDFGVRDSELGVRSSPGLSPSSVLELSVTDDGVGLPHATRHTQQGLGLHIMDYRARTIGGTLQIGPGSRGGTKISCCVPAPASGDSTL